MAPKIFMFTVSAMISAFLHSFDNAPAFRGKRILRSLSVGILAGPGYSAAIVLSNAFPFFDVDVTATGMGFPFRKRVVHFCTGSKLAPDAATAAMLGHADGCKYVGTGVDTRGGRGAGDTRRTCGVVFAAAYCLVVFQSATAAATSRFDINGRGVAVAEGVHVGVIFATTMLGTSLESFTTWHWSRVLSSVS